MMGARLPWNEQWDPFATQSGPGALPVWRYGQCRRSLGLATRRQLRDLGLSIGRQPVAGILEWGRGRDSTGRVQHAWLYRIDLAKPKRTHTPAQEAARQKAMRRRRTCDVCGEVRDYCIPRVTLGGCGLCWEAGRCSGTAGAHPAEKNPQPAPAATPAA